MCSVDGGIVPADQATVSAFDRGLRTGEGVFETLRAYDGFPFRLAAHLERAGAGAEVLGFALPEAAVLRAAVMDTLEANAGWLAGDDAAVRLTATAGPIDPASPWPGRPIGTPTIVVSVHRLAATDHADAGVRATLVPWAREIPHVKAVSYLASIVARRAARERGADEALLTSAGGDVLEAAGANVFVVVDGQVRTPPLDAGILAGVTRAVVIEVAAAHGMPVVERPLPLDDLLAADEAFVTASTREIVPLIAVDDTPLGAGRPGPVTRRIGRWYADAVASARAEWHHQHR